MTHDIHTLRLWLRTALYIAAVTTTIIPVLYSFSPWRSRTLGKMFMLKAVCFAAALDMNALFSIWKPSNILVYFWVEMTVLSGIAISTFSMAVYIWKFNFRKKKEVDNEPQ